MFSTLVQSSIKAMF
ncbi:hypothetical protein [Escherichia coli]|nr:hypothetical protein [Escherichia coli]